MTTTPMSDEDRRVLVVIWARHAVANHSPRTSDEGYTCDEMGCSICNAGGEQEAADWLVEAFYQDEDEPPHYGALLPTDDELLEFAVDWLADLAPVPTA